MECKTCKLECIGEKPCKNCKEPIDKKVVLKNVVVFIAASILFYLIGVII